MPYYSRKSPRIPGFHYASANYYFVTICTHEKKWIFGEPGTINSLGKIAYQDMMDIPSHYPGVVVDIFNILPNHIHAILILNEEKYSINNIIGNYMSGVSRKIRKLHPDMVVWQRSYYDEIIRNQTAYESMWNYVRYNAEKWTEDEELCAFPL